MELAEAVTIVAASLSQVYADRDNKQAEQDERAEGSGNSCAVNQQTKRDSQLDHGQQERQRWNQRLRRAKVFHCLSRAARVKELGNARNREDKAECKSE